MRADVMDSPEAVQMLDLVEDVYTGEEDVFTKRAFVVELADSPEVGERGRPPRVKLVRGPERLTAVERNFLVPREDPRSS